MAKYTDNLAEINTHIIYVKEHLENIDKHLEKLNDKVSTNRANISVMVKLGLGLLVAFGATLVCSLMGII